MATPKYVIYFFGKNKEKRNMKMRWGLTWFKYILDHVPLSNGVWGPPHKRKQRKRRDYEGPEGRRNLTLTPKMGNAWRSHV